MRIHAHTLAAMLSGVGPNEISQSSLQVIIHGSSVPTRSLSRALLFCCAFNLLQARPPGEGRCEPVDSVDCRRMHVLADVLPCSSVTSFAVSVEDKPGSSQTLRLLLEAVKMHHFSGAISASPSLFVAYTACFQVMAPKPVYGPAILVLIACCGSDTALY
jgi:hypothetical protein